MADHETTLRRFRPRLVYDSNEAFFADSASEWTDNPANVLRRISPEGEPSETIAARKPALGQPRLTFDFLGGTRYASGDEVRDSDLIACTRTDHRDMYVRLRQSPGYRNVMYGRAQEDSSGRLWLQYWFYYFYNDYQLAGGFGLHEGDWEMVQLRMSGERPDLAVYAQHRHAQQAAWSAVAKTPGDPDRPVVYVARGSHASYFERGLHATDAWYDIADGGRPAPELRLEIIRDELPGWIRWPGRWGGSRARIPGLEQPSPHGPAHHHAQWDDPGGLLDSIRTHEAQPLPGEPRVRARRERDMLVVELDVDRRTGRPLEKLMLTVNSPDDPLPPRTYTFALFAVLRAVLETRLELDPGRRYEVAISATDVDGRPTASRLTMIGRARPVLRPDTLPRAGLSIGARVIQEVRQLVAGTA